MEFNFKFCYFKFFKLICYIYHNEENWMLKIPVKTVNGCYRLDIPMYELDKIPDFAGNEVFLSFSANGPVLTGTNPDEDSELDLIAQIINTNSKTLEELDD